MSTHYVVELVYRDGHRTGHVFHDPATAWIAFDLADVAVAAGSDIVAVGINPLEDLEDEAERLAYEAHREAWPYPDCPIGCRQLTCSHEGGDR